MHIPPFYEEPQSYAEAKSMYFAKYHRKIDAIISNIRQASIKPKDQIKLKKQLINRLQESNK